MIDGVLPAVKDIFDWLADQPGYLSRIWRRDLHYFKLSAKDDRISWAANRGHRWRVWCCRSIPSALQEPLRAVVKRA
jgi:hypothetical protein